MLSVNKQPDGQLRPLLYGSEVTWLREFKCVGSSIAHTGYLKNSGTRIDNYVFAEIKILFTVVG